MLEVCLGVTPIEGFGAITRIAPRAAGLRLKHGRFRSGLVTMTETLRLSLDALRSHKLRSFLTLLGVILAVTTLVAVMSVVAGLNFYVADRIANLGANVFVLNRFGIITSEDAWINVQHRPLVVREEFYKLQSGKRAVRQIGALLGTNSAVRHGNVLLETVRVRPAAASGPLSRRPH